MGKVALVTGAGRRLGRSVALVLARAGADVIVHFNTSPEAAEEVCRAATALGVRATAMGTDLSQPERVPDLLEGAWAWAGQLDLLVNNASIFPSGRLDSITFEDLTGNMAVNAWAPLALTRSLWKHADGAGRQASVVNLLDSRLVGGDPLHAAYYLSKATLSEITRMAAAQFAPTLTVNAVAPGPILAPEGKDAEYLRQRLEALPLQRWGDPGQVAEAVLYLATASFVTGQTLFVDGGQHLEPWGSP